MRKLFHNNLVDTLIGHASQHSNKLACSFQHGIDVESICFAKLDSAARAIAYALQQRINAGDRAVLIFKPGLNFIKAFLGCLYAKVIAVPAYPPLTPQTMQKLLMVINDCQPSVILGDKNSLGNLSDLTLPILDIEANTRVDDANWSPLAIADDDIAFLQYTSGSTGDPKGVVVSHRNIISNMHLIEQHLGYTEDGQGVVWLPPYHDMGLIGGILSPLYSHFPVHLMSPLTIIEHPFAWLKAISDLKATISGGPNFAYALCLRHITQEQKSQLDLSHWDVAFNGAEPINLAIFTAFAEYFADCGFKRTALFPCYGLAEATLFVSCQAKGTPLITLPVDQALLQHNQVKTVAIDAPGRKLILSSGKIPPELSVAIIHPESSEVTQDIGEIVVSGEGITRGYWNKPELNNALFITLPLASQPFLRTGDLGFLRDDNLFITGRSKDLIIWHGMNHYPQDIEFTVMGCHPAIQLHGTAVFTSNTENQARLVIVSEVAHHRLTDVDYQTICQTIQHAVVLAHQLPITDIVLIPSHKLPKTTSGKVQRTLTRKQWIAGDLSTLWHWKAQEKSQASALPTHTTPLPDSSLWQFVIQWMKSELDWQLTITDLDKHIVELALDSIQWVRFISALSDYLGYPLDTQQLSEHTTLNQLIKHLQATPNLEEDISLASIHPSSSSELSYIETWLWKLIQAAPTNQAYYIAFGAELQGPLEVSALIASWDMLVQRHANLRTCYRTMQGQLQREIYPSLLWELQQVNSTANNLQEVIDLFLKQTFSTDTAPLWRLQLVILSPNHYWLGLSFNHLIIDGWSLGILMQEWALLYNAYIQKQTPVLADIPCTYDTFIAWQKNKVAHFRKHDSLMFPFKKDLDCLHLSNTAQTNSYSFENGGQQVFTLSADCVVAIKKLCRQQKVNLTAFLLLAYQYALQQLTRENTLNLKLLSANRRHPHLQSLVGLVAQGMAFQQTLTGNWLDDLQITQQTLDQLLLQSDIPFEYLAENHLLTCEPNGLNLAFNYYNFPWKFSLDNIKIHWPTPQAGPIPMWGDRTELAVIFQHHGDALLGILRYRCEVLSESEVNRIMSLYQRQVNQWITDGNYSPRRCEEHSDEAIQEISTIT